MALSRGNSQHDRRPGRASGGSLRGEILERRNCVKLKKILAIALGAGTMAAAAFAGGPASAHNGPEVCVLLASPAQVNNVEMGRPSVPGNPLSPAVNGHPGQKKGEGNRYGLYYPMLDPIVAHWTTTGPSFAGGLGILPATTGDHFNWRQTGTCSNSGAGYTAGGTAIGYCGRSIGLGTGKIAGHTVIIKWESAGSQLILVDPSAAGSVNAQANPPGSPNGSCIDGGAAVFTVDGVLVHT